MNSSCLHLTYFQISKCAHSYPVSLFIIYFIHPVMISFQKKMEPSYKIPGIFSVTAPSPSAEKSAFLSVVLNSSMQDINPGHFIKDPFLVPHFVIDSPHLHFTVIYSQPSHQGLSQYFPFTCRSLRTSPRIAIKDQLHLYSYSQQQYYALKLVVFFSG